MFDQDIVTAHVAAASGAMVWGIDDCCQFVRNIVIAHGGPDIMEGVPAYTSQDDASQICDSYGRRGFVRAVLEQAESFPEHFHPWPRDKRLVGLIATSNGPALALMLRGAWIARAEFGIAILPLDCAVAAWEV
jgi:hypothetical protein